MNVNMRSQGMTKTVVNGNVDEKAYDVRYDGNNMNAMIRNNNKLTVLNLDNNQLKRLRKLNDKEKMDLLVNKSSSKNSLKENLEKYLNSGKEAKKKSRKRKTRKNSRVKLVIKDKKRNNKSRRKKKKSKKALEAFFDFLN